MIGVGAAGVLVTLVVYLLISKDQHKSIISVVSLEISMILLV